MTEKAATSMYMQRHMVLNTVSGFFNLRDIVSALTQFCLNPLHTGTLPSVAGSAQSPEGFDVTGASPA